MKVVFNESNHTYKLGEKILISVTRLLKKHKLSPDYSAVDPDVLKRAAGKGIAVHKEIENYIKNGDIGFTQELQDFMDCLYMLLDFAGNTTARLFLLACATVSGLSATTKT